MMTKDQIQILSKFYSIDNFTIMREYLQLIFLSYLYQRKEVKHIYFKGGTAIRLLFGSPRFSEDLDFSTTYDKKQIKEIIRQITKSIQQEIPELQIFPLVSHLSEGEILAEKTRALATRGKGRDFFDVWYLMEKDVIPAGEIDKKTVLRKIKQYSQTSLNRDLSQFLPKPQRKIISILKLRLEDYFT